MPLLRSKIEISHPPQNWAERNRAEATFETVRHTLESKGDSVTDPDLPLLVNQQTAQWLCVVARANFTFPL